MEIYPTINTIEILQPRGPWPTKSGGELVVSVAFPFDIVRQFLSYNNDELKIIPEDIRGLRMYMVKNLPKGAVGAHEFHKVREELVVSAQGSFKWICEDLYGGKKECIVPEGAGLWTHPWLLHTYESLEDNSMLIVIASTLFFPDKPETHDTYPADEFYNLQKTLSK